MQYLLYGLKKACNQDGDVQHKEFMSKVKVA